MGEVDNDKEYCKNCHKEIVEVVVDDESVWHLGKEWRHVDTGSVYCELSKIAEPIRRH